MLEKISETFTDVFRTISGKSAISEKNVEDALDRIKIALLEADVNVRIVRRFVNGVLEEARGEKVLRSVTPGQQFIKIVYDRMVALLGDEKQDLLLKGTDTQSIILLLGLQGSGKTTTAAKLANFLKKRDRKVLLVACDLVRPAAVEQLAVLAGQVGVDIHREELKDPIQVARNALARAKREGHDVIIVDTAGRLQIDEPLMQELARIRDVLLPVESLLVADAMTGQSAVEIAKAFDERIGITGAILTKFDSDTRGGAALSLKSITGKPIKFIGVSERIDGLEPFYPDRIANRILGMGDIVSLVEKAQEVYDQKEALELEQKISKESFTLEDYLGQIQKMKKMGSVKSMLEMIPGLAGQVDEDQIDLEEMKYEEAILLSMTKKERQNHLIIGPSRRTRIAKGSGTSVAQVNRLLKKFEKSRSMMKKMVKNKGAMAKMFGSGAK
ncbi:MAG: Signal recognition particle protein [Spirochaetes bacterium ADurb.Bin110]|nr:MAG: Signal recognition particle protein [Spirochaetes bacterium ADurb.Bin110]